MEDKIETTTKVLKTKILHYELYCNEDCIDDTRILAACQ
jgi:hypothetical protein